jgi:hypothetical protein
MYLLLCQFLYSTFVLNKCTLYICMHECAMRNWFCYFMYWQGPAYLNVYIIIIINIIAIIIIIIIFISTFRVM